MENETQKVVSKPRKEQEAFELRKILREFRELTRRKLILASTRMRVFLVSSKMSGQTFFCSLVLMRSGGQNTRRLSQVFYRVTNRLLIYTTQNCCGRGFLPLPYLKDFFFCLYTSLTRSKSNKSKTTTKITALLRDTSNLLKKGLAGQ